MARRKEVREVVQQVEVERARLSCIGLIGAVMTCIVIAIIISLLLV